MGENKSMLWFFVILLISLFIASKWNSPLSIVGSEKTVKDIVSSVLDPSLGILLRWNIYFGFIVIIALTSLVLTLAQKYLSDQAQLKELRKEQKLLNEEMKKYKEHPEKLLALQKKQFEFIPKTFNLTMKPLVYTSIPILLFFRWFGDYFSPIFGGWWILWYIIGAMIFSSIFRKTFDVA
jgi:uncharacterized membrane protein (DUF106 family)